MTALTLAYSCLGYIGEFSLDLTGYTDANAEAPDSAKGVFREIVSAINRGQQELFRLNPGLFKREVGATVKAPVTGTVTVTNGSTAVSATTFTDTLAGNTILIAGMSEYNTIRTEGSDKKLLFPYTGTTGTKAATLYGDAVLLDAGYSRPLGPVWLSDIRVLTPLAGKGALIGHDPRQDLNSDWGRFPLGMNRSVAEKVVAQPEAYFAETHLLDAGTSQRVRLFLSPLPERQYSLRFDAQVKPTAVVRDDIGEDDDTDPGRTFPLPDGADDAWLETLVLYYWSRSTFFKNPEARQQIARDRAEIIPVIESWRVQPQTGGHIVSRGWK